jgi:hypothetical protein
MLESLMVYKKYFIIISSIIVLTPLLGAIYMYHIVSSIEAQYTSKYDVEEVVKLIENSEDIESLKKISLYAYFVNMKVIEVQHEYIYRYIFILFLLASINLILIGLLYKKYLYNSKHESPEK